MEVLAVLKPGEWYTPPEGESGTVLNIGDEDTTIVKTYKIIEDGSYTPKELGIDLPGCTKINVGICSHIVKPKRVKRSFLKNLLFGPEYTYDNKTVGSYDLFESNRNSMVVSSGHVDYSDPTVMCIKSGRQVLFGESEPSDTVLHEYAHILSGDDIKHKGHGPAWKATMIKLGQKPSLSNTIYALD